jgi:hypothetical protein
MRCQWELLEEMPSYNNVPHCHVEGVSMARFFLFHEKFIGEAHKFQDEGEKWPQISLKRTSCPDFTVSHDNVATLVFKALLTKPS